MSLSPGVLIGSAAYLFVGLMLVSGVFPPLATAMLAAPFALLVPAGVGLITCFGWRGSIPQGIGRIQAVLTAWLFGMLVIIYAFVLLERIGWTGQLADPALGAFFLLGAAGFLRLRGQFAPQPEDWLMLRLVVMVASPLVVIQYLVQIPLYSDYPILDLFQRTHFHKGAYEFANFGMLNPFVADSYVPFQQLLLGLQVRGARVDPIVAEWVLPIAMAPLRVGAIFVVASRLTKSKTQVAFAIGFFLTMSSITNPTNQDVASLAALLLMSFLLRSKMDDTARAKVGNVVLPLAAIVSVLVLNRLSVFVGLAVLLGAGLLVSAPALVAKVARAIVVAIVIFAAISFHRSGMLFVALVVAIYIAMSYFERLNSRADIRSLTIISLLLLFIVAGMTGRILFFDGRGPQDEFGLWTVFDSVLKPMAGKSMTNVGADFDLAMGSGGRISLFEVARSLSFIGLLVGGLLFRRVFFPPIGRRDATAGGTGVALMMVCLLMLALTLTGFPFVHRSSVLIAALLSVALAVFVGPPEADAPTVRRNSIFWSIILVGYMACVMAFLLLVHDPLIQPFIERVFTLSFLLIGFGLAIAVWFVRFNRAIGLPALLVVTLLIEGIASRAYFKHYAFMSQAPANGEVYSHFGHRELATADTIVSELERGTVLVSDTKTMALMGARSGLTALVSFSNLNTMVDKTRSELLELLGNVAAGASVSKVCAGLRIISDWHGSSQLNYEKLLRLGIVASGSEALAWLGYSDALVASPVAPKRFADSTTKKNEQPFAVVISPDTLDWIDHPSNPNYFPLRRDVNEVADAFRSYGSLGHKVGDAFLLLVRCE